MLFFDQVNRGSVITWEADEGKIASGNEDEIPQHDPKFILHGSCAAGANKRQIYMARSNQNRHIEGSVFPTILLFPNPVAMHVGLYCCPFQLIPPLSLHTRTCIVSRCRNHTSPK